LYFKIGGSVASATLAVARVAAQQPAIASILFIIYRWFFSGTSVNSILFSIDAAMASCFISTIVIVVYSLFKQRYNQDSVCVSSLFFRPGDTRQNRCTWLSS
jgi:glycerol-3-phosphate acyltransferase PlsY